MIANRQDIKQLLESRGIKPTLQRLKILESLLLKQEHPTADMIYQRLVADAPTMSKTTVYNTLNSLVAKGLIFPVTITGTEVRYDAESSCHHHFLCERCGSIIDINIECPKVKKKEIDGHLVKAVHGYFLGICARCLAKH
jgi:Fe2+ or Zn2+ uptake regulation protein